MPTFSKSLPRRAGNVAPLVIIAVLAAVAIGGYFLLQKNKGTTGLPNIPGLTQNAPRATEKDFEFIEDPTLRKHFATQANQAAYRTETASPGSGLTHINEVQIKGDSSNSREIQSDGSKEIKHTITIGDTIYLKDYADGKWWKQTLKYEEVTEEEPEDIEEPKDFKEEYSKPDITYKSLGKEACGSLTCFKYEMFDPQNPEIKRTFWFDDKDYLLRKEQGGFGEFIATTEYSYDGINITAPSPTKDVPEGKSIYEYQNGASQQTPSQQELEKMQQEFSQPSVSDTPTDY